MSSILHIKNMVCPRCITAVDEALNKLGLDVLSIELGKVEVSDFMIDLSGIRKTLESLGFELLSDREEVLADEVRTALLKAVNDEELLQNHFKLSSFLEENLGQSYYLISRSFSQTEQQTIEKFFIKLKIEKAKELIAYNELSVKEIAARLGYSSVQHFYTQFKQISTLSVKEYKDGGTRQSLDNL